MKVTKLFYKKDFIRSCKKEGKLIKFVRIYSWEGKYTVNAILKRNI